MPNGMKHALIGVMTALILYCLLGFLILPGVAERVVNQQLAKYATVPARLERIEFNPFTLNLKLHNLHMGEPDAEQLAFERLFVDLDWDSLWSRSLHFSDIELIGPNAEVLFDIDGKLNLAELFELPSKEDTPAEDKEPLALRIDRLQLAGGRVHFADQRTQEPIDFLLDSLDFELLNFATRSDDAADAVLVARGPDGSRIKWKGQLNLSPVTSTGQLEINGLALNTFWPYVRDMAPLALNEGQLSLKTEYQLDLSKGTSLQLSDASATLASLSIDSLQGQPLLRLEQAEIAQASLDLPKRQLTLGQLRSQALESWLIREPDGQLNWQRLLASKAEPQPQPADTEERPAQDEPQPTQKGDTSDQPWRIVLRDAELRNYQLHLADKVPEPNVELELGPLDLDVRNFDSRGTAPMELKLTTEVGKQGSLLAEGQLTLTPMQGSFDVTLAGIDLRLAQPYLSPFVHLELRSGLLASQLAVELTGVEPLAFHIGGSAEITQLHTLDTIQDRDLVKWQSLQVSGLDYSYPNALQIEKIDLNQPYARFIINPDLTTNINDLLVDKPSASPSQETPPSEAPASPDEPDVPFALRIGGIQIAEGSANFADLSLRPPFITAIQDLGGSIGTLDNRQHNAASVDIEGKVDRYAPVSIEGSLTPFEPLQSLDITTRFRQVELTTLSPYSAKFAGYRIRKGRLNLDLHYRIQQGQLNAENEVVLEELQLGEKVDSEQAVDLPVRLAVALLKDSSGTIALKIPVQGDLKNPQFDVVPIIWQTLRNLVVRAAKSPFKFLGGLVGREQADLSQILFPPGSSELDSRARSKLDTLASALKERPVLRLEVEGMSAPAVDGALLAEQWLEREYQQTWYKVLQRRGDTVPADPSMLEIGEEEKAAMLEGIYRSRLQQQPPAEWQSLDPEARTRQLRQAILSSRETSTALLRRLSRARAASIKDYLVDNAGLAADRVYLLDTGITQTVQDGGVPTVLHLEAE
ncbi:DUF748 domain-containing protein [Stutzerimonas zhaodongensis]|jgi:outer membrane protein OmpA-like peptidoglycan-associated protein|uniref:DUF748 domain-containing protein n=1 Tax=Stutzerimonas zhaodongensis TaxID=1176257 RepID=A0A365PS18_9GAMM|nr:DUF748 domain-containing protein [Stutzerimonas zhaodongensis]QWV16981.1 DUF748 domain-containing protein [Stutzerimonas zhaodongensis]RBA55682.1 hypothetical protein DQ403_15390 [Stutzerimonas zhaodongensis]